MKKEFSFYEFVGILVPSITLLFFLFLIVRINYQIQIIDLSKIGDTIIFLAIAYAFGHILQAVGNIFEKIFWKIFKGMPTNWLTVAPRLAKPLFNDSKSEKLLNSIHSRFGVHADYDYGREVYSWLSIKDKITEKRIDLFNANYSMFRGLSVSFYLLSIICFLMVSWQTGIAGLVIALLANTRMFRFGRLYAVEVFNTYLSFEIK
jgi:hypothetical protein